jgi:hypothetical protein
MAIIEVSSLIEAQTGDVHMVMLNGYEWKNVRIHI